VAACEVCGAATRPWHLLGGGSLDRCPECGHLTRDLERCPAAHRDHAYGGEPTLDRARLILTYRSLVANGVPESVFEIGYGGGGLLRMFHDAGAQVGGVDPDQLQVGVDPVVAKEGDLRVGTVEDLDPTSVSAELVVGVHVLEHVLDPARTLEGVRAITMPGGRIAFLTPAGDSWGPKVFGSNWWMLEDPTHIRFFSARSLALAAERAGFTDVVVDRPLLDSLSVDAASVARMAARTPDPRGTLARKGVLLGAVASTPMVTLARLVRPSTRPTLRLTARVPL
jgi:SAM-dependent methyltransferase